MEKCNTETLYLEHRQRLLSLIQSKVGDSQKAEDLLHDSFIKLQTCCNQSCECEKPKAYLFRLALNIVFDFFRGNKKNISSVELKESNEIKSEELTNSEKENCDMLECIVNFLDDTSIENRLAFTKVDLQQIPQVQVAKELNIPLPTLKSRVQRTRKFLKHKIEACCQNFEENCI